MAGQDHSPLRAQRLLQGERRRARTRAKLLAAAYQLFAEHGHDISTIEDICAVAKVARGTFYNHYTSRDAIFAAVADDIATGINSIIEPRLRGVEDPAIRTSVALRIFAHFAVEEEARGWILLRTLPLVGPLNREMRDFMVAEFDRGVESGRFRAKSGALVFDLALGLLIMTIRRLLTSDRDDGRIQEAAEAFLIAMGVEGGEAGRIAGMPIDFSGLRPIIGFKECG